MKGINGAMLLLGLVAAIAAECRACGSQAVAVGLMTAGEQCAWIVIVLVCLMNTDREAGQQR